MSTTQMTDQTQPRSDCIYVSRLARAGLYLAKVKLGETYPGPDGLADLVITEWLAREHPDIYKHLVERDKADKLFRDGLKPRIPMS